MAKKRDVEVEEESTPPLTSTPKSVVTSKRRQPPALKMKTVEKKRLRPSMVQAQMVDTRGDFYYIFF